MRRRLLPPILAIGFAVGALGCDERVEVPPPPSEAVGFDQLVQFSGTIPLEENSEVINVTPDVSPDPAGGFIVSDSRESQVRLYREDGTLVRHLGSKGYGPAEFQRVSSAVRVPSGDLLVTDMGGKVARFDSTGTSLLRTAQAPLGPLYTSTVVNDSLVAFTGRYRGRASTPLVHLWDVRKDSIVRSFFPVPAHPKRFAGAYAYSGFTDVSTRGDTIAVLFALSDTVYLYDLYGQQIQKIKIPFERFRLVKEEMPANAPVEEVTRWTETYSAASQLFWAGDGSFVVQYFDRRDREPQWRLLRMTRQGERVFEFQDTPKLLTMAGDDPTLYFVRPDSPTPNVWSVARFAKR